MQREVLNDKMERLKREFDFFREKIKNYKYVCLFGTGKCAKGWGYEFATEWVEDRRKILFFTDNNPNNWGKTVIDGLKCLPPDSLIKYGKDIICIVLAGGSNLDEILKQLEKQGTEAVTIRMDWLYIDYLIEKYLNIKLPDIWEGKSEMGRYNRIVDETEKVAVYTCVVGKYDELIQPFVQDSRCDYYYLGIKRPKELGIYQWINIADAIPQDLEGDYTRINRYCKTHPHLFFPQYQYSIYIDGNISVHTEVSHLIQKTGRVGIASYGMLFADDIYEHATSLFLRKGLGEKDGRERITRQMQKYASEGFPRFYGLTENGVMVREHHNKECIRVMDTWWNEIVDYSRRDQLSFMYALWKNGFTAQDLGYIDDTYRNGPEFSVGQHKTDLADVKYNLVQ